MLDIAACNGTLEKRTVEFFEKAGIPVGRFGRCYHVNNPHKLISRITFMRPTMIPQLVQAGLYDFAIVGSDVVAESLLPVAVLTRLDFSARGEKDKWEFRVVLLGGRDDPARSLADIPPGCIILSEYPNLTRQALQRFCIDADVSPSPGTTEAHVGHDFDYGVCVASTEETLNANGLKIIDVLSTETTVLVGGSSRLDGGQKEGAARDLFDLFVATKAALQN